MYRIGLTGGIATGKSTVAAMLRNLGACVIDADQIAREIVEPGQPAYQDIVNHFGSEVLLANGQLNRPYLAQQVFNDQEALKLLNRLTHPRVIERIEDLVEQLAAGGYRLPVVLDIPLLIEAGMADTVDQVWLVIVDSDIQLQRLMQRNNLTEAEAKLRINAQMSLAEKARFADCLIDNSGSLTDTQQRVGRLWALAVSQAELSHS